MLRREPLMALFQMITICPNCRTANFLPAIMDQSEISKKHATRYKCCECGKILPLEDESIGYARIKEKKLSKPVSQPVTRGITCPKCGNHIHLVIQATERRKSGKTRKKLKRMRK